MSGAVERNKLVSWQCVLICLHLAILLHSVAKKWTTEQYQEEGRQADRRRDGEDNKKEWTGLHLSDTLRMHA